MNDLQGKTTGELLLELARVWNVHLKITQGDAMTEDQKTITIPMVTAMLMQEYIEFIAFSYNIGGDGRDRLEAMKNILIRYGAVRAEHGYCPFCDTPVVSLLHANNEDRSSCGNAHVFPSSKSKPFPRKTPT